mmetsp:Transcript_110418/g.308625  ORF Transcript_110418/g.308625 Transcript_110418/m.308625 type:complete len:225 (-) Transcript_110418:251-925(-)
MMAVTKFINTKHATLMYAYQYTHDQGKMHIISRMKEWNESMVRTWMSVYISLSSPPVIANKLSILSTSSGLALQRNLIICSTRRTVPKIANTYVTKNITTVVQNNVRTESLIPRINIHASRKQGTLLKTCTRRTKRNDRNAEKGWMLPERSNPLTKASSGRTHVSTMPVETTRNASKQFSRPSAVLGTKELKPKTFTRNPSSTRKNTVKKCSDTMSSIFTAGCS